MNRLAFITGASSGFGRSCARIFSENGWRLVLAARRTSRLEELQKDLGQNAPVHIIPLDVRRRESVKTSVDGLPEAFGDVDVLVNNAGLALGLKAAHETDPDDWDTMVDTNCKGLMYCTRYILPGMVERNRGHIINLGSIAGDYPYPGGNVYGATKAFVKQFSRNLRADLVGKKIRVTNIEPDMADTEFSLVRFQGDAETAEKLYENTESLTADDIAGIIYWVATQPPHVNINRLEVMPTCQAWGHLAVSRDMA